VLDQPVAGGTGVLGGGMDERALPDARVADEDDGTTPFVERVDAVEEQLEEPVTTDEGRAHAAFSRLSVARSSAQCGEFAVT